MSRPVDLQKTRSSAREEVALIVSNAAGGRGAGGGRGTPGSAPAIGFPRGYSVQVSADEKTWSEPVAPGKGEGPHTTITFAPTSAHFIRITQTESVSDAPAWSIRNLRLYEVSQAAGNK